ncbi:hypothetical protein [Clostridium beijerinckii]|uniref:Uncharacterized protein n=1 Tax=Clostridium beijerinckii TaxID=1520 RepID=A0AAE5H8F7_CLOBE|nr:hypothetical protein [Clostridium beijerinckii]NSB15959.1 hypothetical protein [Clostridium beijerinckii]OOM33287.1 hypothetical protein CLOBE_06250 [Clostridium beijerinckii]
MINKDEPLPEHTKVDYYESYAKIVLEELYPEEFVNLEIKDKPDLQMNDGEYGIEVTNAIDEDQREIEKLYVGIQYNSIRNKNGALAKINKLGGKLYGGILAGKPGTDSFDLILSAFDNKLNLLNGKGYKQFKWNCLFIFSDIYADDRMIIDAIKDMQQSQKDREKQFYKVFILVPGECYCSNLCKGSYEVCPIPSSVQGIQAHKARALVEKYEEMK